LLTGSKLGAKIRFTTFYRA